MDKEKEVILFFKYALFVPFILTIFLEWLNYMGNIKIEWFWILSPLWIWLGGAFQFLVGGMLVEFCTKNNNGGKK